MKVTIKNILRACSAILVLMFILPTFAVSCGSVEVDVSAFGILTGVKYEGQKVSDPNFFAIFALLVPVVLLALWFAQKDKIKEKMQTTLAIIIAAVDWLVWVILAVGVRIYAGEEGLGFRSTLAYSLNNNLIWIVIVLCILVKLGVFTMETDVVSLFSKGIAVKMPVNGVRCVNCGEVFSDTEKFCKKCGAPKPEAAYTAPVAEPAAQEAAQNVCAQCGEVLKEGQKFCAKCGAKSGE